MSHRAKNAFAMVSSIVNNSFPSSTRDERATCLSRITALAKANEILVAQNWRGARLTDIVERVMKPHSSGKPRIHLSGPDVSVDSGRAVSISLILNELATNAVKYGALSLSAGRVDVEWEASESDLVQLRWREHGGPEVLKPQKRGFGSRLIERGLTAEFDSVDLEFLPEGVLCILQFATTSRVD
jgi:two-component sensor histidine kinase